MIQKKAKKTDKKKHTSKKKWFIENVVSLLAALLLVLVIRSSIIEAFKIPSGSMIPTLLVGDHIFVNKFSYGYKVPFTDWVTEDPIYFIDRDPPKRGDIIVFKYPEDESKYFIKRVVGIPGDIIEIKNKQVFVNGIPNKRTPLTPQESDNFVELLAKENSTHALVYDYFDSSSGDSGTLIQQCLDSIECIKELVLKRYDLFYEQIGDQKPIIMHDKRNIYINQATQYDAQKVPENNYFVLGDNRDSSKDSRFWGYVPIKKIRGKALVIWLSLWLDFSNSDYMFRPSRVGSTID